MAQVDLENVSKIYPGNVKAVNDVSLQIRDREFIVLVGPSGCGKSTTLRMLAGLETTSSGTLRLDGQKINDVPPKDRDLAMVFQNYVLYPHLTVYQNMAFGLKLRGLPRAEIDKKVNEAAALLGVEHLLARKPKALSGGQRQRVAVGRAIVRTPKAFLFDEPLSNLDAKLRLEMRSELKRLQRRLATTTLYVTHDQEEAMSLGDRVVVMKNGVVQQAATPMEVYEQPANRFVAEFMGMPPANFLTGRIVGENGHLYFCKAMYRLRLPARLHPSLSRREGSQMVLGIRPQALSADSAPGIGESRGKSVDEGIGLSVTVCETELLGEKMDVFAQTSDAERIVCRVDSREPLREGMRISLHVNMDQVHVFEPGDEGVNVSLNHSGERTSAT